MAEESLEAIMALLAGDGPVTREAQLRSTDLVARKVIPHFSGQLAAPREAWAEMKADAPALKATIQGAQLKAAERHEAERRLQAVATGE